MNDDNFHFERTSEKLSVARLGTCSLCIWVSVFRNHCIHAWFCLGYVFFSDLTNIFLP